MKIYQYSERPIAFEMIAELFKHAFNKELDFNYWHWRFLQNPVVPKQYINYIIEDGELVAYYAVSPCNIIINKKTYKIALSNMTMTHPNYTGKGYFKQLANALFRELKKDGFIGVFGFANANSHYGFRKNLGWKDLSILNMFSLEKKRLNNYKVVNKKNYELKINQFSASDVTQFGHIDKPVFLDRSSNWLKWRLVSIPTNEYLSLKVFNEGELIGLIIYKNYQNSVDIMEIFYKEDTDKFDLLNIAFSHLFENIAEELNCWVNLHSEEHLLMEKLGFINKEFNTYFGIIPFVNNSSLLDVRNWHYRLIDSDVF